MITYKHKTTGQLMTIEKMHGDIATCKLLVPVASKVILNKPFNDVAICNINNLETNSQKQLLIQFYKYFKNNCVFIW